MVRPGVDFTKLFLPSEKLLVYEKFTVQFYQQLNHQISSLNWRTLGQICMLLAKHCAPKMDSHSKIDPPPTLIDPRLLLEINTAEFDSFIAFSNEN